MAITLNNRKKNGAAIIAIGPKKSIKTKIRQKSHFRIRKTIFAKGHFRGSHFYKVLEIRDFLGIYGGNFWFLVSFTISVKGHFRTKVRGFQIRDLTFIKPSTPKCKRFLKL